MQGWIKLHRQLLEWEWYGDLNTFRLFTHLLLMANHKDKKYKGLLLKAGTVITGRELLAKQTGLTVQQVRTSIDRLISTNEITNKTSPQGTIIQIVKYIDYQVLTNEVTIKQPTSNQQVTTNKNVKKVKNEKKPIPTIEEFVEHALSRKANLSTEDIKLKYFAWVDNDWCINRNGDKHPIKNWKASLTNTVKYLKERYKQPLEPIEESIEDRIKRINLEAKR